MKTSLIGWGVYVAGQVLRMIFAGNLSVQLVSGAMSITGLMMIYGSGVFLY